MPELSGDTLCTARTTVPIVNRKERLKQSFGDREEMAGGPGIEPGFLEPKSNYSISLYFILIPKYLFSQHFLSYNFLGD